MASEVERIGEESRRYTAQMRERMADARVNREARDRELAERSAAEMREFRQEMAARAAEREEQTGNQVVGTGGPDRQDAEQPLGSDVRHAAEANRLREVEHRQLREEELRQRQETAVRLSSAGNSRLSPSPGNEHEVPEGTPDQLDPRAAIARSIAARRRNDVVAPVDDDGDDEAEYYRRRSWLI